MGAGEWMDGRTILTIAIISLNSINQLVILRKIWIFSGR
jgi:hypothetical protein